MSAGAKDAKLRQIDEIHLFPVQTGLRSEREAAPMTEASFQPRGYLRFDLAHGLASTPDKRRHLVVPAEVLREADRGEKLDEAARRWGEEQGEHLAGLVGDQLLQLPPERFLTELSRLLATLGWGWCTLESWGGVLFVVVQQAPRGAARRILQHFLGGVFTAASGHKFVSIAIPEGNTCRFLLTGPENEPTISEWVRAGATAGIVASRMLAGEHLSGPTATEGS